MQYLYWVDKLPWFHVQCCKSVCISDSSFRCVSEMMTDFFVLRLKVSPILSIPDNLDA